MLTNRLARRCPNTIVSGGFAARALIDHHPDLGLDDGRARAWRNRGDGDGRSRKYPITMARRKPSFFQYGWSNHGLEIPTQMDVVGSVRDAGSRRAVASRGLPADRFGLAAARLGATDGRPGDGARRPHAGRAAGGGPEQRRNLDRRRRNDNLRMSGISAGNANGGDSSSGASARPLRAPRKASSRPI